jgi:hypothetical protein
MPANPLYCLRGRRRPRTRHHHRVFNQHRRRDHHQLPGARPAHRRPGRRGRRYPSADPLPGCQGLRRDRAHHPRQRQDHRRPVPTRQNQRLASPSSATSSAAWSTPAASFTTAAAPGSTTAKSPPSPRPHPQHPPEQPDHLTAPDVSVPRPHAAESAGIHTGPTPLLLTALTVFASHWRIRRRPHPAQPVTASAHYRRCR